MTFRIRDWIVARGEGGWVAVTDDEYHNVEWASSLYELTKRLDLIDSGAVDCS